MIKIQPYMRSMTNEIGKEIGKRELSCFQEVDGA